MSCDTSVYPTGAAATAAAAAPATPRQPRCSARGPRPWRPCSTSRGCGPTTGSSLLWQRWQCLSWMLRWSGACAGGAALLCACVGLPGGSASTNLQWTHLNPACRRRPCDCGEGTAMTIRAHADGMLPGGDGVTAGATRKQQPGGGAQAGAGLVPAGVGSVTVSGRGGSADVHTYTPAWAAACRSRPCRFAQMEDGEVDATVVSAAAAAFCRRCRRCRMTSPGVACFTTAGHLCCWPVQPFMSQFGEDTWLFHNLFYNKRNGFALEFGGCWALPPALAAGCWLLAVGCWQLAAGCWLLAAAAAGCCCCYWSCRGCCSTLLAHHLQTILCTCQTSRASLKHPLHRTALQARWMASRGATPGG